MLRSVDPTLDNLMYLRDVVIPWMEKHPKQVDFDTFGDCGTVACLLGHYVWKRHGMRVTDWGTLFDDKATHEFGLRDSREWLDLFGNAGEGTLADRKARLERIIEARVAAMEVRA